MKLADTEIELIIEGLRLKLATYEANSIIGKAMKRDIGNLIKRLEQHRNIEVSSG